ncbi:MAG TPA: endonuclease/exonuclease/phosphatase family protein [Thermoanaerobaculia bacterium]|nr:endonuclease/exonuclease/phosphatase family protein [Thermoanaerobaculia bacterium]
MRIVKRIAIGFAAIILIAFSYRVLSVYEFRSGECRADPLPVTAEPSYPRRLVVMSYNIQGHAALLHGDHIAGIAATINKYRPDVVGINEAHRRTWQSRFRDQVTELSRATGMNAVFGESYEQLGGQFGNAILTRGRVLGSDVYKLPGTGEPRTLLEAKIGFGDGTIVFYVTHLVAWEKLNRAVRGRQLDCLTRHLGASAYPYVLTGDLNAPPDSPEIVAFRRAETMQLAGPASPTHRVMELAIDYVMADRGWRVASSHTMDDGPSDHRPVLVELVHERP